MSSFFFKIYKTPEAVVLAVCDAELLGKTFRDGDIVLDVPERYYGGEEAGEDHIRELLSEADIISLVGAACIELAIDLGLAEWRFVKRVGGVPHLNIYRL